MIRRHKKTKSTYNKEVIELGLLFDDKAEQCNSLIELQWKLFSSKQIVLVLKWTLCVYFTNKISIFLVLGQI